MKLTVLQENLSAALSTVNRAAQHSNDWLAILSHVLLRTANGRLQLAANDLEIAITCDVGARIEEEGAITAPARLLANWVKSAPCAPLVLSSSDSFSLSLQTNGDKASMKGLDPEDFDLAMDLEGDTIELEGEELRNLIQRVVFAAATDISRPVLTGVLVHNQDGILTLAAADGFQLATATTESSLEQEVNLIVPARALREVYHITTDEEPISMTIPGPELRRILFRQGSVTLATQLIEGNYPDYAAIIPKQHTTRAILDRAQVERSLKLCRLFAKDDADIVRWHLQPGENGRGRVQMQAKSADNGEHSSQLEVEMEGEELTIALAGQKVLDFLRTVDTPWIALETTTASSPGALRSEGGDDHLCVIMPMMIS